MRPYGFLGETTGRTRELLGAVLSDAVARFGVYAEALGQAGLDRERLAGLDPLEGLALFPPLGGPRFDRLVNESILLGEGIVDMETSSGTTGPRKRRIISAEDDVAETAFLARLFGTCGIVPSDKVACVDTGPLTLMASFTKALDLLGVAEAYCLSIGPDAGDTVALLARLRPTVVVTVPSVLDRLSPALGAAEHGEVLAGLRAVVYAGEPLSSTTRAFLQEELGVEAFGYYGSSETSALGIECGEHDGVHLFTDRNVIELVPTGSGPGEGELLVTTLHQRALPLVRYALHDVVEPIGGPCKCGLSYPRVDVKGRSDGTVSVLGSKLSYSSVATAVHRATDGPSPLEVVVTANGNDALTIALPRRLAPQAERIRKSLLDGDAELGFLAGSGLLEVALVFEDDRYFSARKPNHIEDRR